MRDIGVAFFLVCGVVLLAVRCDKTAQKETPLAPPDSPTAIQESGENNTSTEAPEKEPLRLAVPNRGVLTIRIPEGTVAAEIASKVPGAACLRLEGSKPDPFIITLTALGVPGMMPHFGSNAWLQEELERWKSALPDSAVAADAIPLEFQLDKVRGVYVNLQDSSAETVAYPCLLHGFFNVDGCIVSFQVLHTIPRASAANRFLALLTGATWEPETDSASTPVS